MIAATLTMVLVLAEKDLGTTVLLGALTLILLYVAGTRASYVAAAVMLAALRHPIMLGFIIAFWATPNMSQGHLLFAVVTTVYIFIGIKLEERDLVNALGATYEQYRERVGMLIPRRRKAPEDASA